MRWFSQKEKSSDEGATAGLLHALRDRDPNVCSWAAEEARVQRLREAVPALVELLYRTGPGSKHVITAAARALGDIGDLRAMQHLGEAGYAREYSGALGSMRLHEWDANEGEDVSELPS